MLSISNFIRSTLGTRDGSAIAPDDYTTTSQNLVIAPGDTSKSMIIPIVNDGLTEGLQSFSLDLTTTNNNQISIQRSSALVLIEDDDSMFNLLHSQHLF